MDESEENRSQMGDDEQMDGGLPVDGDSISDIQSRSERGSQMSQENAHLQGDDAYVLTNEQRALNQAWEKSRRLRDFYSARLHTLVNGPCSAVNILNMGIEAIQAHLNLAETSWEQFEERHMWLVAEGDCTDQRAIDLNHHLYSRAENDWVLLKSRLQGRLNEPQQTLSRDNDDASAANVSGLLNRTQQAGLEPRVRMSGNNATLRIGNLSIEAFNGDSSQWANFKSKYLRMVHENPDIGAIEKLSILLKMMAPNSEPHDLLEGYTHEPDNYPIMWKQLCDFYDDDLEIVTTMVNNVLDLPGIARASREALMTMVNVVNKLVLQMPRHGVNTDGWGIILVPLLIRKVDGETRNLWVCDRTQRQKLELADFLKFLTERARTVAGLSQLRSEVSRLVEGAEGSSFRPVTVHRGSSAFRKAVRGPRILSCYLCKEEHGIYVCPVFRAMSNKGRVEAVRRLHLCFLCLKPECNVTTCTLRPCKCGMRHNQLLCLVPSPSARVSVDKQ